MSFKDIIGQEVPKKILLAQIREDRIATGYLFYGPEGVGKTLTAKTFVKAINCEEVKHFEDSCDSCQACKEIDALRNPDFEIIIPEQSIKISQIRALKVRYAYKPTWLKMRVAIIKDADKLTEPASNAFLKILEEPPSRTMFILITSRLAAILPTIKSRCQEIKFRRLKPEEIEKILHKHQVPKQIIHKVSIQANGSITRALKLLSPETEKLQNTATQFLHRSPLERMQIVEELDSLEQKELLLLIQELYADLLRKKLGVSIKNKNIELKKELSIEEILHSITICEQAFYALSRNVQKRFILYKLSKELL